MNPQLAMVGNLLSSCVDLAKGTMGEQFAVSIVCRHKAGPCHMLIGDDTELGIIAAVSELQRMGTPLINDGSPVMVTRGEVEPQDDMLTLLRDMRDYLFAVPGDASSDEAAFVGRIDKFLDKVN